MAQLNKAAFEAKYNDAGTGIFKTGQSRGIGSEDTRALVEDSVDSLLSLDDNFIDEDSFASDSATKAPSQQSVKAYIAAQLATGGTTREFNRAFSSELLFDKNEIAYELQTLSGDLAYTVAADGHIEDQFSSVVQRIETDGTRAITFTGFTHVLGDIQSGNIPDAGTYVVMFLYYNGISIANWGKPSQEVSNLPLLQAPQNLTAAQDGETAIDVDWTDNPDSSGARVSVSLNGVTGWTLLATLDPGVITYKHTGLAAGDQRFYRVQFIGNNTTNANSNYSYADTTITEAGDVTAPVPSFLPADTATDIPVNRNIVITFDEAIQNTDTTEVTNANVAALITLKETDAAGANIAFTATINGGKTQITITPTVHYGGTQLVYAAVNNFEDVNGNEETTPQAITFTTSDYSELNGTSNIVLNDDILDGVFAAADTNFWLEVTIQNFATTAGVRRLISKSGSVGDRTFSLYHSGLDVFFAYYMSGGGGWRFVKWTGALTAGERKVVLKYDGSIDTNNGLDRAILEIDDVVAGSKSLSTVSGSITSTLVNSLAKVAFGINVDGFGAPVSSDYFVGEAKGWVIRSAAGATVSLNIPILKDGIDTSGNGFDATWV